MDESEYLLRPRRVQDGHTEIYSVDSVHASTYKWSDLCTIYQLSPSWEVRYDIMHSERYYHTRVKRCYGAYDMAYIRRRKQEIDLATRQKPFITTHGY